MIDYKQKYLKYKQKYLTLVELSGGNEIITRDGTRITLDLNKKYDITLISNEKISNVSYVSSDGGNIHTNKGRYLIKRILTIVPSSESSDGGNIQTEG
jgi:hypothetical protein